MDHAGMTMDMRSALGPYPMSREGSGTSWQPASVPMEGIHGMRGDWMVMAHGFFNFIYDHQSGPRGDSKAFSQSMLMVMGQRPAAGGTLGLRAMLSLDPAMGKAGYPLLFQTGETADGRTPLVDRQHPHDFFMELSASYTGSELGVPGQLWRSEAPGASGAPNEHQAHDRVGQLSPSSGSGTVADHGGHWAQRQTKPG